MGVSVEELFHLYVLDFLKYFLLLINLWKWSPVQLDGDNFLDWPVQSGWDVCIKIGFLVRE